MSKRSKMSRTKRASVSALDADARRSGADELIRDVRAGRRAKRKTTRRATKSA